MVTYSRSVLPRHPVQPNRNQISSRLPAMKVSVKWGKEVYNDVDLDTSQPPLVFKSQIFTLTGVPPERQKVMIKGGLLKDEEWGKQVPKEGMTIMMMGSADAIKVDAPVNAPKFVEDLPEDEQDTLETKQYGSGLANLGNTCYMNSTIQCLYSVEGLRAALGQQQVAPADGAGKLVAATKKLFKDLEKGGTAFPPFEFLLTLREQYPQFAQQTGEGLYMQQDAEECFTQVMYCLKEKLKGEDGSPLLNRLFGVKLETTLKCEESGEEMSDSSLAYSLKCNIAGDTNYLHQGLALGLVEDREKNSEKLGRLALFKGASQVASLPPYLTVQLVRFFYKADVQQKAKILRKVTHPMELDMYDFCTPELKKQLEGPRNALKEYLDKQAEEKKTKKQKQGDKPGDSEPAAAAASSSAPAAENGSGKAAEGAGDGDVEMKDAGAPSSSSPGSYAGQATGKYQLTGVLTHKGRSADSGHYTAWIKQKDGTWQQFDDDKIIPKTAEDVLGLCGGGDWHMAYLLLYQEVTVPADA